MKMFKKMRSLSLFLIAAVGVSLAVVGGGIAFANPNFISSVASVFGVEFDDSSVSFLEGNASQNNGNIQLFAVPKTAFVIYSADDQSFCFYKRERPPVVGEQFEGKTVTAISTNIETSEGGGLGLSATRENIIEIKVVDDGIAPTSLAYWFSDCNNTNLSIEGLEKINVSNVSNMSNTFLNCNVTNLDLSMWDTSNVTTTSRMFLNSKIENLNVYNWNTSKITDMGLMFGECSQLTTLDLSGWDTSNVTSMSMTFRSCNLLSKIYVSNLWNVNKLDSNTSQMMFYNSTKLPNYNVTATDKTKAHYNSGGYLTYKEFTGTRPVQTVAPEDNTKSAFAIYSSTDNSLSFYKRSTSPQKYDMFEGKVVTDIYHFIENDVYKTINEVPWRLKASMDGITSVNIVDEGIAPKSMSRWFSGYWKNSPNFIGFNKLDCSNLVDMSYMFAENNKITTLDLSSWNITTHNPVDMSHMFENCLSLKEINMSGWEVSNVTDTSYMFYENIYLKKIDLLNWNTKNVINMEFMFYEVVNGWGSSWELDLSSFDTSNVTNMTSMFESCETLSKIYISELWNTNNVTKSENMFVWTSNLSNWNDSKVKDKTFAHYNEGGYLTYKAYIPSSIIPTEPATPPTNGTLDESTSTTWNYIQDTNTLTLESASSNGTIPNYTTSTETPWKDYKDEITSVEVKGISTIGSNSLSDLSQTNDVKLDNSVQSIGDGAFKNDITLSTLALPETLTTIESNAFKDTGLTEVIIPSSVTTIGGDAFKGTELKEIVIPASVQSIGDGAFADVPALKKVVFESPTPPVMSAAAFTGSAVLTDTSADGIIVPEGAAETYITALPQASNSITAVVPKSNITITVAPGSNNTTRNYQAYKIFNGTINTDTKMSELTWASEAIKNIVVSKLTPFGITSSSDPQQAAEVLRTQMNALDRRTILAKDNIGMDIAREIKTRGIIPSTTISVNEQTLVENGYYIIFGEAFDTPIQNVMASSPIYTVVGAGDLEISEKSSLPITTLKIKEDSDGSWSKIADHTYGQLVNYKATISLPENFVSFANYICQLKLSANGYNFTSVSDDNVKVYIDKNGEGNYTEADKITTGYVIANKASAVKGTANEVGMTVTFNSLSSIVGVNAASKIVVEFAVSAPNDKNNRKMYAMTEYSANPVAAGMGQTVWDVVDDYSYNMKLNKLDKATSTPLSGAAFTIKNENGLYIAKDAAGKAFEQVIGTAEADAYRWTTGSDGVLNISGVDADKYTVKEVIAPESYNVLATPFKIDMRASYTDGAAPVITSSVVDVVDTSLVYAPAAVSEGYQAEVIVKNVKNLNLPFTGEQGIAMMVVFGMIMIIGGMGIQLRKRQKLSVDLNMMD